jgi:hypothetical protein
VHQVVETVAAAAVRLADAADSRHGSPTYNQHVRARRRSSPTSIQCHYTTTSISTSHESHTSTAAHRSECSYVSRLVKILRFCKFYRS